MKKIVSLILVLVGLFTLVGCFDDGDTISFEIVTYPKTTYTLADTQFDWSKAVVKINDETYDYDKAIDENVKFEAFAITGKGTFSVTAKYQDITASVQFTVLDSYFANGNGTKENPYQISTFAQLNEAFKQWSEVTYFVLINDIVLGAKEASGSYFGKNVKNIHINGQGYALRDVRSVLIDLMNGEVTFVNINIYANSTAEYGEQNIMCFVVGGSSNSTVHYKDVNIYGIYNSGVMGNASIFGRVGSHTDSTVHSKLILENVNNYMDLLSIGGPGYSSLLVHGIDAGSSVYVINTNNYGNIFTSTAGLFSGNGNSNNGGYLIIDNKSHNYGKVVSTLAKSSSTLYANRSFDSIDTYFELRKYTTILDFEQYTNLEAFTENDLKDFEVNKAQFYETTLTASIVENKLSITCSSTVEYYIISLIGASEWYDVNGNYTNGLGTEFFSFGKDRSLKSVEAVNGLNLCKYKLINKQTTGIALVNKGSIKSFAYTNQTLTKLNGINTYVDEETYYVFEPTRNPDGTYLYAPMSYNIIVTAMDANDKPLGSVQAK